VAPAEHATSASEAAPAAPIAEEGTLTVAAINAAGKSDPGRHRERNEDSFLLFPPLDEHDAALYIVADGMGGHAAGEVASSIAVNTIGSVFRKNLDGSTIERIDRAIQAANESILETGQNSGRQGMGSTVVCAVIEGRRLIAAHAGDSRLYRVRQEVIERLTHDHSWVQAQVDSGFLTQEVADTLESKNIITRALGLDHQVKVDINEFTVESGDRYIMCTDGLSGLVKDPELAQVATTFTPQEACGHLIELANERGGPDNVTAIVIEITQDDAADARPSRAERAAALPENLRTTSSHPEAGLPAKEWSGQLPPQTTMLQIPRMVATASTPEPPPAAPAAPSPVMASAPMATPPVSAALPKTAPPAPVTVSAGSAPSRWTPTHTVIVVAALAALVVVCMVIGYFNFTSRTSIDPTRATPTPKAFVAGWMFVQLAFPLETAATIA
jgi:serine/threonine protein phosphatase PrpC